jgi:chromosome partitioning protein
MIIATTNSKGGVGKSTIAVHLAVWLADRGKKVLLIDADHQESSSRWIDGVQSGVEFLTLHHPDDIVAKVADIATRYEYTIIDGPASLDEITRAILDVTDKALLPCGPSLLDIQAADQTLRILNSRRVVRGGKPEALFVRNKLQAKTRLSRALSGALEKLAIPVAQNGLHLRQAYADAVVQRSVVMRMGGAEKAAREIELLFTEVCGE